MATTAAQRREAVKKKSIITREIAERNDQIARLLKTVNQLETTLKEEQDKHNKVRGYRDAFRENYQRLDKAIMESLDSHRPRWVLMTCLRDCESSIQRAFRRIGL